MKYYSDIKKNGILPFARTWMELEYHAKRKKSIRERQILYDLTHMWNFSNKTNDDGGGRGREANQETDS